MMSGARPTTKQLDLIPGTLCDYRLWSHLAPLLDAHYTLNDVPLHQARNRAQMHELIANHSAASADLVAFSLGAYLALEYTLRHPQRVRSLVLVANSARGLSERELATRRRIIPALERNAYVGMTHMRLREILHPSHLDDLSITSPIEQMALDLGKEVLLAQFAASMERPDLMARMAEIDCPVLIVGAEDDQLVNPADLLTMCQQLPNAQLRMHQGTGHMIPLEAPQALAADILTFYGDA